MKFHSVISAAIALSMVCGLPAQGFATDHGDDSAAAKVHKEHLRHFSLMNMLISEKTEDQIQRSISDATGLDRTFIDKESYTDDTHISHIFWALIAFFLVLTLAALARRRLNLDADAGVLPTRKMGALLFFEVIVGAVWSLMKDMLGADQARRYFPIIGTLAIYIFIMNILALLPFGAPATDNLNTNVGMALVVFFATHYAGIKTQGIVQYAKHFMGPVIWLAVLMVPVEIVGHLVRPVSLSLRLMGNMTGDHNVLFEFAYFKIPLIPLPVMALGLLVCMVQALVFVILSTVYLSMATTIEHDDEAHDH
jgi:F-type H+-transporting ATPase subunit a